VGDFYLGSIEKEKAHDHRIMSCAFLHVSKCGRTAYDIILAWYIEDFNSDLDNKKSVH